MGSAMNANSSQRNAQGKGKMVGPFVLGRPLGFGTTSRVHLAIHSVTKSAAAVKIIRKRPSLDLRKLQREISILRLLNHRYITRLYDVFESKNHIYMVMELVDGGELFDHIIQQKRLRRYDALRVFRQVAEATSYFHRHGIAHRDIKPENILVHSSGDIKIADFGFAIARRDASLRTSCGSPHYACPEVCSSSSYDGTKADSWSLGVLLFVLITGDFPFNDQNYGALFHRIQTGKYMIPSYVDQDIADLITRLLTVDPDQRLTVDGILNHSCMGPFDTKTEKDHKTYHHANYTTTKENPTKRSRTSPSPQEHHPSEAKPDHNSMEEEDRAKRASNVHTQQQQRCREIKDWDSAPLIRPPYDPKALQELVYLGWADTTDQAADALQGKTRKLSPTIITAYHALLNDSHFNNHSKSSKSNSNSTHTPCTPPVRQSSSMSQTASSAPMPSQFSPSQELCVRARASTSVSTASTIGPSSYLGGKEACPGVNLGVNGGRRRRWTGSEGGVSVVGPVANAAGNKTDFQEIAICTGGPTAAAVTAAGSMGSAPETIQKSSPEPFPSRRALSEPMRLKDPTVLKGGKKHKAARAAGANPHPPANNCSMQ